MQIQEINKKIRMLDNIELKWVRAYITLTVIVVSILAVCFSLIMTFIKPMHAKSVNHQENHNIGQNGIEMGMCLYNINSCSSQYFKCMHFSY